ncbi:GPI transamidase component PIG-T [Leptopilina heterotoma]|uniref:GPI transamidase component PIG-T n=1 Tax=Leptopilina heterotoma TaxID=63436 RepID=UPI001CA86358|nr:GPI transamidase component PIG-T [Leptopilina heterotoma]
MSSFTFKKSCILLAIFCIFYASALTDTYDEELMLKPLPSGYIYAFFQFTTLWEGSNTLRTLQHSHLFPRGLGEILGRHQVDELHFTLTEGLWRHKKWGYPFQNAGPGAEISAWFKQNVSNVDKEWISLTSSLAGLLCASLNFIDSSNSLSPEFSMQPTSALNYKPNSTYFRYATLPRETACTENLTPFKKLLPCDSKKGLSTLMNSAYIHNTNYHSIGIHFRSVCRNPECTKTSLELRQTVSLIYDILSGDSYDWSIRKLFGTGLKDACTLATMSNIYVDISTNKTIHSYKLMPEANIKTTSLRGGQKNTFAIYDIKSFTSKGMFNIAAHYTSPNFDNKGFLPILLATRYINGYGQQKGTLVTKLQNNHWQPLDIILLENIPWYLSLYLHTVKIMCKEKPIRPFIQRYIPGKERKRPYYLELVLQLPPHSITKISIDFDYLFLKWQEYPPDANHGFYAGPAIITASLPIARNYTAIPVDGSTISSSFNASRENYVIQLRTDILLISLPTPDFSMPYNVICLACTAVALAFGPLHNISTKKLVLKRIQKSWWKNNKYLNFFLKEKAD